MSSPIITENCYTCVSSLVHKQICKLKNRKIQNIHRDKCEFYFQREMKKCEICGCYVIELKNHIRSQHNLTDLEYLIKTKKIDTNKLNLKRGNLWP